MEPKWSEIVCWRELVQNAENETGRVYQLVSPITDEEVQEIETKLDFEFPFEMLSLYRATNGIKEVLGDEIIGSLVWASEDIIERNLEMRTTAGFQDLYMSFDNLLFFSEVGNGDLFAIPVLNHKCPRTDVFLWEHETDSRIWVAGYLFKFLENWTLGKLKI